MQHFIFRAAEFFTLPFDPDKESLYDKFIDLFYNVVFKDESIERFSVPYEGAFLPVIRVKSKRSEIEWKYCNTWRL